MLTFLNGLMLGLSLISSLGPQNIFLIRQSVMRRHVFLSAAVCFGCDIVLVVLSVVGLQQILSNQPILSRWMALGGAAFMCYYGIMAFKRALTGAAKTSQLSSDIVGRWKIIMLALGFSLLNPYAIIDTLLLIGGNSRQYPDHQQAFLFGVLTSSLIWFSVLTLTAYYFATCLKRATVWRVIEALSGGLMITLGIRLFMVNG